MFVWREGGDASQASFLSIQTVRMCFVVTSYEISDCIITIIRISNSAYVRNWIALQRLQSPYVSNCGCAFTACPLHIWCVHHQQQQQQMTSWAQQGWAASHQATACCVWWWWWWLWGCRCHATNTSNSPSSSSTAPHHASSSQECWGGPRELQTGGTHAEIQSCWPSACWAVPGWWQMKSL